MTLADGHLSLYQLTIEPNTQFHTRHARGEFLTASDENAAAMYELTQTILGEAGMPAYEISNHARDGAQSRHNLAYWHYDDYIGIGLKRMEESRGEASWTATDNHRAPEVYLKQVREQGHGLRLSEALDATTAQREALMMGLRLTQGVLYEGWQQKFGGGLNEFLPADKITRLQHEGYLARNPQMLKATQAGLQRLNAVLNFLMN